MIPDFNFIGFEPADALKKKARLATERLFDTSPYGSVLVGMLEKDNVSYKCAIEIYSPHGPFIARASDASPEAALERVIRSLSKKLEAWKEKRRFTEQLEITQPMTSVA